MCLRESEIVWQNVEVIEPKQKNFSKIRSLDFDAKKHKFSIELQYKV